jgi:geranylgeranyl diphosphate synthase type 3
VRPPFRLFLFPPLTLFFFFSFFAETGGLIRLGVRLLGLHPDCSDKQDVVRGLIKYGEQLGVYYQIRDDFVSLTSEEYAKLNGFAEDLHEGKYSFPIIHSLDVNPHSGLAGESARGHFCCCVFCLRFLVLPELLAMKPDDVRMKKAAISLIARTHSFEYTIHALRELGVSLRAQLAELGGNDKLEGLLQSWTIKVPSA